jgi:ssDNA-binding Zn-finger/Zn-ribbon topoisomerase 1
MALRDVKQGTLAGIAPTCPECGEAMALRQRKRDGKQFWGCSGFPKCYGVRSYEDGLAIVESEKKEQDVVKAETSAVVDKLAAFAARVKKNQEVVAAAQADAKKRKKRPSYDRPVDDGGLTWVAFVRPFDN